MTKTFYLLDNFVGRYASGQTWIEALPPPIGDNQQRPARSGDGVSPIILSSNDLAAGWAGDDYGSRSTRWCPATRASTRSRCAAASTW